MGTIVTTDITNGTTSDAGVVNNNFSAIKNVVNGNIEGSNIASSTVLTITSATLTGVAGLILSGNGGKDTLNLSNTTADVGITIGGDVTLYRSAADTLKTDDAFVVGSAWRVLAAGTVEFGTAGAYDTNLYRSAANVLKTDDAFEALTIKFAANAVTPPITTEQAAGFRAYRNHLLAADANAAFQWTGAGVLSWGAGGASAVDTNLYRLSADVLATDDLFYIRGALSTDSSLWTVVSGDTVPRLRIRASGQMEWGPGGSTATDTNLYRSAADLLKTDDEFEIANAGGKDTLKLSSTGASTGLTIGGDVTLYRGAADILATDDTFRIIRVGAASDALQTFVGGESATRFSIDADGRHQWSNGTDAVDTSLFRSAANVLKTDDTFDAAALQVAGVALASTHLSDTASIVLTTGAQTISGAKTFSAAPILSTATTALTVSGGAGSKTAINITSTTANTGITIGGDVTLYRAAANKLKTDDTLVVGTALEFSDGTTMTTAPTDSTPPGVVLDYAGSSAPTGYLLCDGSAVSRTTYADLFAAINISYGSGDGSTTFNIPDFRGRMAVGLGTHTDVDALGDSDGDAVGDRRPAHAHTHSLYVQVSNIDATNDTTGRSGTDANVQANADVQGTIGPTANRSVDAPSYLVVNKIIKT